MPILSIGIVKLVHFGVASSPTRMYYVTHRMKILTRTYLHLGIPLPIVANGDYRKIDIVKGLVKQVFYSKP